MPKGLKALIAFLVWGIYVDSTHIFLDSYSIDIALFEVYGIADLIYVIWAIVCLLALLSIYFIIKKHPYGIYSLYTYFAINVAIFILGSVLEFIDIDTAREIFTQSREMRGLNTDNVNIVISPVGISIFGVIYLAFYAWLARYVYTTESYFQIQKKNPRI